MRSRIFLALVLFAAASAVRADWQVHHAHDRLTGTDIPYLDTIAAAPDRGVAARLQVDCVRPVGAVLANVVLDRPLGVGRAGIRFRVDERAPEMRVVPAGAGGAVFTLYGFDARQLAHAKRFRVELTAGGAALFYDFDVGGGAAAFAQLGCRRG